MTTPNTLVARFLVLLATVVTLVALHFAGDGPDVSARESSHTASSTQVSATKRIWGQTLEEARRRSGGCLDCHSGTEDMHSGLINLACVDCHGGDATVRLSSGAGAGSSVYDDAKNQAHIPPRFPKDWPSSANPERSYTSLNLESPEFVQFVNPGDLRVAHISCGTADCHPSEVHDVRKSMMTTGAMLWGAALYNNGAFPLKNYRFGESYSMEGKPQRLRTVPRPSDRDTQEKGILPYLDPLPRWEIAQMGNILRTFEKGGPNDTRGWAADPPRASRKTDAEFTQSEGAGNPFAHGSGLPGTAEDPIARPDAVVLGHKRPARRLPIQRMYGVSRRLCQRSRSLPFRGICSVRTPGPQPQRGPDHSQKRARSPDQASVYPRHPLEPVHGVPRSPGNAMAPR